jgi:hypothetical protein
LGKLQTRIGIGSGVNLLSNSGYDAAQFSSGPFAKLGRALLERGHGVVGIDITIASLKEETQRLAVKYVFNHSGHHTWEISGIKPIVGVKDNRMASVINQDGERGAGQIIDAKYSNGRIDRRGRNSGPVWFKPGDCAVVIVAESIVTDVTNSISDSKPRGDHMNSGLMNSSCNFSHR